MPKYIIDYENAHFCGGQLNVVVNAKNEDEAQLLAEDWMQDTQQELFSDEYNDWDEEEELDECAYTVNSVEVLDENNEHWEFYRKPDQAVYYPEIN